MLTWGIGLEHEMRLFHMPGHVKKITEFVALDTYNPTLDLIEEYEEDKTKSTLTYAEYKYLKEIIKTFEPTGRRCNKKWVLKPLPVKMPEFITGNPFGKLHVEDYADQLLHAERTFNQIILRNHKVLKQKVDKYGAIALSPYGMASYIKVPDNIYDTNYKFHKKIYEDYTGSFHITITLPFVEKEKYTKTDINKFVKTHENFANHFQWIEPLLLAAFFSCDQKAVGTKEKRVRGSFRVMRVGWGSFAGSDVRKLSEGVGRYSSIKSHWREGLDFHDLYKLKYCDKVSIPEKSAISALGSNFRTFGSTDPDRPWHRESGAPMTIPNGVEIRIFDHFNTSYLKNLCQIIVYIAANSKNNVAKQYVYENEHWINAIQQIMKEGWKAVVRAEYVQLLEIILKLKLSPKSLMAFDVLEDVVKHLYLKNHNDLWIKKMVRSKEMPKIPNINRNSWEFAYLLYLNRCPKYHAKLKSALSKIPKKLTKQEFREYYYGFFSKQKWNKNIDDIIYFLENRDVIKINGDVLHINHKKLFILNYTNSDMAFDWWDCRFAITALRAAIASHDKNQRFYEYKKKQLLKYCE